jgi:hypothetical protein
MKSKRAEIYTYLYIETSHASLASSAAALLSPHSLAPSLSHSHVLTLLHTRARALSLSLSYSLAFYLSPPPLSVTPPPPHPFPRQITFHSLSLSLFPPSSSSPLSLLPNLCPPPPCSTSLLPPPLPPPLLLSCTVCYSMLFFPSPLDSTEAMLFCKKIYNTLPYYSLTT